MLTYWLMFLIPSSLALFLSRSRQANLIPWIIIAVCFILLIGFRFEVGGDWWAYLGHYNQTLGVSFPQVLTSKDPGHGILNWLMASWNLGVYGVNVVYGTVFTMGLIMFSRTQIYPWIAMATAVPYMVIVVAMGYSRQSMALGVFMMALVYLRRGRLKTYIALIFIGALFHKTAVVLLPLGILIYGKGLMMRLLMIIPVFYGAWDLLLADAQDNLVRQYIDRQMQSDGAMIRVIMNLLPSVLLLLYRKEWKRDFDDYSVWFWIAVGSIISMVVVNFASTAVDRMALYFIPIQLAVYSRLPYLARKKVSPATMKVMIVLGYMAVLFVWLNFATHSGYWIPYQNILLMGIE